MSAKKYYFAASYFGLFGYVAATAQNNLSRLHPWIYRVICVTNKRLALHTIKYFYYFRLRLLIFLNQIHFSLSKSKNLFIICGILQFRLCLVNVSVN